MNFGKFHDKYYKHLLLIPLVLTVFSLVYLGIFYSNNGDFFKKDITLAGGTSATVMGNNFDVNKIEKELSEKLIDLNIKNIYDVVSMKQKAIIIETAEPVESAKEILEDYFGYELNEDNSSFEYTSSSLSDSFYKQLLVAAFFVFLLMAVVVFFEFKSIFPSITVITSISLDILMSIAMINILGMRLSSAGIVAFLATIGFSVDTNIMLSTRMLKRGAGNEINNQIYESFKTGITMALTSIVAIALALALTYSFSEVLSQIFTILLLCLLFDLINSWIVNVSILKWYTSRSKK